MRGIVENKAEGHGPLDAEGVLGRHPVVETGLASREGAPEARRSAVIFVGLAILLVVWAAANLLSEGPGFAMLVTDKLRGGEEAASALTRFFAALVLVLFLAGDAGRRMRWVAGGLVVLGLGHLAFGYLEPLIQGDPADLNESLYENLVTQTFACALFAVGLFPGKPSRLLAWAAMVIPTALVVGYLLVFEVLEGEEWMVSLVRVDHPEMALKLESPLAWLTPWHMLFSAPSLGLAVAAAVGAFRLNRRGLLRNWLLVAMTLLAGSVLHGYLWPSTYSGEMLTSSDVLALAFTVVIAVGGILELRRVAQERAALLSTERERVRRMGELAALKADFSAMVAHELDGPIAAIRRLNEMLCVGGDDGDIRGYSTAAIEGEVDVLTALARDVREAAAVERDHFGVEPHPVPLSTLLREAEAYASTLPGDHPLRVVAEVGILEAGERVLADKRRVGQVIRNLLSNAAKYSPDGTPIEIRAMRTAGGVRIEVADRGPGIHHEDLDRIFEKFGRGRDGDGQKVSGVGLGLYLSRRIMRGHGLDLTVSTTPGEGSVFGFDLEVTR